MAFRRYIFIRYLTSLLLGAFLYPAVLVLAAPQRTGVNSSRQNNTVQVRPYAQAGTTAQYSLSDYIVELKRVEAEVDKVADDPEKARTFSSTLPDTYLVEEGANHFSIDNEPVKRILAHLKKEEDQRDKQTDKVRAILEDRVTSAEQFSKASPRGDAADKLRGILQRPEFKSVQKQTPMESFKDLLLQWLLRALGRGFEQLDQYPNLGAITLWTLGAITLSLVCIWIYRTFLRDDGGFKLPVLAEEAATLKSYRAWLQEAYKAIALGDFREAIHLGYWAGIRYLEEVGAWRTDLTRTPREYLAMLPKQNSKHPVLSEVTRTFERIWYGNNEATMEDAQAMIDRLEKMGCKQS